MCDINDSARQRDSRKIIEEESARQLTSFTYAKIFTIWNLRGVEVFHYVNYHSNPSG